jgi:hypothetical protein
LKNGVSQKFQLVFEAPFYESQRILINIYGFDKSKETIFVYKLNDENSACFNGEFEVQFFLVICD